MELYFTGLGSIYEPEHVARIFYPGARPAKTRPGRGADMVRVRKSSGRLLVAVRDGGVCTWQKSALEPGMTDKETEYAVCRALFLLLCAVTGQKPPWGMLTGVRPVRLVHDLRAKGQTPGQIASFFQEQHFASEEKYKLSVEIADRQRDILAMNRPKSYSLYISIPFCPSRCSYCSFVSRTTAQSAGLIAPYVEALRREVAAIAALARKLGLELETLYIGGGTPTAISARQLEDLMGTVSDEFDVPALREYTVEAGRPDCTDEEKLAVIKRMGATRISINPQTLSDEVLRRIGRKHSAQDIIDCYHLARRLGHGDINMDLIAGLPGDTPEGFARTLRGVMELAPENITVHTLTLKRASNLVIDHSEGAAGDVRRMLEYCRALPGAGYQPYYLYRQKSTLENLENVGYAKPGFTGLYNIFIMEEVHTILSAGAGGSTKLVEPGGRIQRIFNYKYPAEYIKGFDEMLARKRGVEEFYGKFFDLDPQAPG